MLRIAFDQVNLIKGNTLQVMNSIEIAPADPVLTRAFRIVNATLAAAGRPLDASVRLDEWFRAAGLPMPHGTDIQCRLAVTTADPMLTSSVAGFGTPGGASI